MAQPQPIRPEESRVAPIPIRGLTVEEEREAIAEGAVTSVANPLSMGLTILGLMTFMGGAVATGFYAPASIGLLVPVGFLLGVAQILAGMWAFRKADNLQATLFTSYGAFWLALSALIAVAGLGLAAVAPGLALPVAGMLFAAYAVEMVYLWIASMRHSVSLAVVTGVLLLSLALVAIGAISGSGALVVAGGWAAIVCSICAWYTAAAHVINDTFGGVYLPVGPTRR